MTQARQRLEMQRNLHGEDHPDFATGLNHLALLLIMHDVPDEAEPLLHQALAIRKLALGEGHPDYATCLSSLGGLLWARGDLDTAEPLLHQAHAIRCRILGVDHPRSRASQSCLEQFLQMKGEPRDHAQELETTLAPDAVSVNEPAAAPIHAPEAVQPTTADPEFLGAFSPPPLDSREPEPERELATQPEAVESSGAFDLVCNDELETEPQTEIKAEVEEHGQAVRDDARSHSMSMNSNDLSHELVVLTDIFTDLSEPPVGGGSATSNARVASARCPGIGAIVVPARLYPPPRPDAHTGAGIESRLPTGGRPGEPGGPDHTP